MTLPIRSFLFIPGDSEKKLGKVDGVAADAFILDLEDAVAVARKPVAREMVPAFIKERPRAERKSQLWVRVNPLDTPWTLEDLAAIVPVAPDGIMLPKVNGPEDVAQVSHYLSALEAASGVKQGSIRIIMNLSVKFFLQDYIWVLILPINIQRNFTTAMGMT